MIIKLESGALFKSLIIKEESQIKIKIRTKNKTLSKYARRLESKRTVRELDIRHGLK